MLILYPTILIVKAIFFRILFLYICRQFLWYIIVMDGKLKTITNNNVKVEKRVTINHHSNPIVKNLVNFSNSKVGEKFSIKDLLR
ncbi:MAG: hypothetical protein DKM22_03370 [Candidatus Melainabacteria bacterium]|nr:MAG: hypothetical protein DKM22_03370 [Candidatus Melainabacteria bacterium]